MPIRMIFFSLIAYLSLMFCGANNLALAQSESLQSQISKLDEKMGTLRVQMTALDAQREILDTEKKRLKTELIKCRFHDLLKRLKCESEVNHKRGENNTAILAVANEQEMTSKKIIALGDKTLVLLDKRSDELDKRLDELINQIGNDAIRDSKDHSAEND